MSATTAVKTASSTARRPARPEAVRHAGRAVRQPGCPSARSSVPRPTSVRMPVAAPTPATSGTHLTTRGRVVLVAVLVLLLLAAFSLGRTGAEGSTEAQPQAQLEEVVVMPGETLWALAERLAPGRDPRPVVDEIRRLNNLSSGELQAGQQLLLPVAP